jgi:hypothetical protein
VNLVQSVKLAAMSKILTFWLPFRRPLSNERLVASVRVALLTASFAMLTFVPATLYAPAASAAWNTAPKIWGTPPASATRGVLYSFKPGASDANGDALTFSIANKPGWMTFSRSTGRLSGTPGWYQVGKTWSNIVIKVSDGKATKSLPAFSIKVVRGNRAPTISGSPPLTARVGQPYAFKPTARDADGDKLTFSIANKPGWARFDASNGTLWGTPTWENIGKFADVRIKVTDGKATASLAPFTVTVSKNTTGSVTLNWTSPTRNADGTLLTNLAGYRVHYGQASRNYTKSVYVVAAATHSVVIDGLAAGNWYFAIRSVNTLGVTSALSSEVRVTL